MTVVKLKYQRKFIIHSFASNAFHAYFLRLEEVLLDTFPGLAFITEEEGFRYLVSAYLEAIPPVGSGLKSVSENLPRFLKDPDSEVDYDF
ncbi:MAG: hypothetical protein EOP04_10780, partial [Proteobacteria bacterium]